MLNQAVSERSSSETIGDVIRHHATQRPDATAIVAAGLLPLSYRELSLHIQQVGDKLQSAGLGSSARVGIMLPGEPEAALLGVAVASHVVSVPLNPRISAAEFEQDLVRFNLDAIVSPDWQASSALNIARKHSLAILLASKAERTLSVSLSEPTRTVSLPLRNSSPQSCGPVALMLRTSGTTGPAKLVSVTHGNLIAMASKMQGWFGLSAQDRCACILPTYYAQGLKTSLLVPLLLGGSVALPAHPSDDLAAWVTALNPTWFSAGPTYLRAALDRIQTSATKAMEHALRFIVSASAPLPQPVRVDLEAALRIPILECYGLSEAGLMAANPAPPQKRKSGTAGIPASGELAIRGQDGHFLPSGEVGEIVVRGPSVSPGYLDGLNQVHAEEGYWLATGDLGLIDSDGFLTIVGRTKEIINRGGEKISPYEIEEALLAHPDVRDAAAFPVPHPRLGENVAASVILNSGASLTSSDLRAFLNGRLADFKIPQHIYIVSEFPKGDTGKVSRSRLAADVATQVRQITTPGSMLEFQIAEIWQRLTGRADISVTDVFFELGGDSLLWVQMLMELDTIMGRPIPQSALRGALTIRELADALMNFAPIDNDLITCVQDGTGRPFFFCHGDLLTRGFYGTRLARLIGNDQPFFLLHPHPNADLRPGVTGMARSYVSHLLALQPTGAFRVGGFCNGGLLAWEIAHQLAAAEREVEFVVLIDTISLNARRTFRVIERALRWRAWAGPEEIAREIMNAGMRKAWAWGRRKSESIDIVWHESVMEPADKIYSAMVTYVPPKVDTRVVCVLSEETQKKVEYLPAAWNRLSRELECAHISGQHHDCVTIHLGELATVLSGLLSD